VVSTTPTVERSTPGTAIGRISLNLVSIPPEKRIILSDTIPMNWASLGLSKCNPRPSLPKNIPIKRNRSRVGMPKR
jgi:hypothetical protein